MNGGGTRLLITTGHHLDEGSDRSKRVRNTRKTLPSVSSLSFPDPGHPTPRRWKRLRTPFLRRSGGVRWACLAIFFVDLGVG